MHDNRQTASLQIPDTVYYQISLFFPEYALIAFSGIFHYQNQFSCICRLYLECKLQQLFILV